MRTRRGFTLIELLIVVAIIAILAAIAVPNFLEARNRAKVSRVQNDLRVLVTGIESYHVDHGSYPGETEDTFLWELQGETGANNGNRMEMRILTTPISYTNSILYDVYIWRHNALDSQGTVPYRAYARQYRPGWSQNFPLNAYSMMSIGPDLTISSGGFRPESSVIDNEADGMSCSCGGYSLGGGAWDWFAGSGHSGLRYDPTNGTISTGDVMRWGGTAKDG